jgi:MFS family permease
MAPEDARGRYQGAFVMTWGGGALVAPRLGTLVWQRVGPLALWLGCFGLGVFVAGALLATARERRARVAAALDRGDVIAAG